jgi:hypothetical protein
VTNRRRSNQGNRQGDQFHPIHTTILTVESFHGSTLQDADTTGAPGGTSRCVQRIYNDPRP